MLRLRRLLGIPCLLLLSALSLASTSIAATVADVTVADEATVGGQKLVLNGVGVREATMLKVKVYVMGLYLPEKSQDAEAIIASDGNKRIAALMVASPTPPQPARNCPRSPRQAPTLTEPVHRGSPPRHPELPRPQSPAPL